MYYRFNLSDLEKTGRKSGEYYTLSMLKKHVPLTQFEAYEDKWIDGTWFVYSGYSHISSKPLNCKSLQEAYENLLEAENLSLYEYWNDL